MLGGFQSRSQDVLEPFTMTNVEPYTCFRVKWNNRQFGNTVYPLFLQDLLDYKANIMLGPLKEL